MNGAHYQPVYPGSFGQGGLQHPFPENNPSSQPSSTQVSGKVKLKFQMNLCLVCNKTFVEKAATTDEGLIVFLNLCHVLQVPAYHEFVPESNPVCKRCSNTVEEYLRLQQTIKELMAKLGGMRKLLTKELLDTYPVTPNAIKNYTIKKKIFEKIKGLVTSKRKVTSADSTKQPEFEETFREIINSLEKKKQDVQTAQTDELQSLELSRPVTQEYSILDISNMVSSAVASSVQGDGKSGSTDGNSGNEVDNMSMGCLSPTSPPNLDEDLEEREIYVKNLTTGDDNQDHLSESLQSNTQAVPEEASRADASAVTSNQSQAAMNAPQWIDRRKIRPIITTQRRTHPCKFCGKLFPALFSLQLHERSHTGEKPFICSICNRGFAAKAAMQKHELTHDKSRYEGEPQYECDLCGKKYHLERSLYTHKRDHLGIKRLRRFRKKYPKKKKERDPNVPRKKPGPPKMIGPRNKRKPRPPRRKIKYDADGNPLPYVPRVKKPPKPPSTRPKKTSRPSFFARYKRGQAPKEKICSVCGKEFRQNFCLRQHMLVHTGEKPLKCPFPECPKSFAAKGNLDKHMRTHDASRFDGEPKHICDFCGKAFHILGTLYHHRRKNHLGFHDKYLKKNRENMNQPGECKICGETFATKHMLSAHKKRQHGSPNFTCEVCGKPFYESREATDHVKTHDPKWRLAMYFRLQCSACPAERLGFPSKGAIREHWLSEHPDEPIPKEFKNPPKPNIPGHYVCQLCPEADRKKYNTASSLLRHKKKVHRIGNVRKSRASMGEKSTNRKLHQRKDHEDFMSTGSSSDEDADLDLDGENIPSTASTPVRRSNRQTRGNTSNIIKLLQDLDEDSDCEETKMAPKKETKTFKVKIIGPPKSNVQTTGAASNTKRAGTKGNTSKTMSTKLTDAYVRKLLDGRELRLQLVRFDECIEPKESPTTMSVSTGASSRQINTRRKPSQRPISSRLVRTANAEAPVTSKIPDVVSGFELELDQQAIVSLSVDDSVSDDIKIEPPPSPPQPKRPNFSAPMVIHNPLLKNKAAKPIVITPSHRVTSIVSSAPECTDFKQEATRENETDSEAVLGI